MVVRIARYHWPISACVDQYILKVTEHLHIHTNKLSRQVWICECFVAVEHLCECLIQLSNYGFDIIKYSYYGYSTVQHVWHSTISLRRWLPATNAKRLRDPEFCCPMQSHLNDIFGHELIGGRGHSSPSPTTFDAIVQYVSYVQEPHSRHGKGAQYRVFWVEFLFTYRSTLSVSHRQ